MSSPTNDDDLKKISGHDTNGKAYKNIEEMWSSELSCSDKYNKSKGWYGKALKYWENTPATINGVLGGMEHINDIDIKASESFIKTLGIGHNIALDCGAGIGRITKTLLIPRLNFTKVDLLEPVKKMIDQAKKEIPGEYLENIYHSSLEQTELEKNRYDLIIIQWVAIYLTDEDFIKFLKRCKEALTVNGIIFFKENCSSDNTFLVDKIDSSVTRCDEHYKVIFKKAGVNLKKEEVQPWWPQDLMMVKMYALK